MGRRRTPIEERCPRCLIRKNLCFCVQLYEMAVTTRLSVIMHVSELKLSSNTVNLARLVLPQLQIYIRGSVNEVFMGHDLMDEHFTPLYLFPDEESVPLPMAIEKMNGPFHLIVPDGNWHQAKKVKRRETSLSNMISVRLPDGLTSRYTLRRPPFAGALCTFEALAHALACIEGEDLLDKLLPMFDLMVSRHQIARSGVEIIT